MLPTVHKRCLSAAFAAFLSLLAAAPAQAAQAPKIKTAYAVDSDRDGHVDGVSLNWSKKVHGGADAKAPFALKVRGYRVTSVGSARGKAQRLQVAERPECDTGGSVRLSYRGRNGTRPVRLPSGKAARAHKLDMRRFDRPVPRITCAVTLDADSDARVDGVRVTYSREVRSRRQASGRFLFSVGRLQGHDGRRSTRPFPQDRSRGARQRGLRLQAADRLQPPVEQEPAEVLRPCGTPWQRLHWDVPLDA